LQSSGDLAKVDIERFLDDELDDFTIKTDQIVLEPSGARARKLEGTGKDEGDDIVFRIRAFLRGADVLVVLVYGEVPETTNESGAALLDRVLRSLAAR